MFECVSAARRLPDTLGIVPRDMQATSYAIRKFISEKLTEVRHCGANDVSEEFPKSQGWLTEIGLVAILHNHVNESSRPFAVQFLRRCTAALDEYSQGTVALRAFVTGRNHAWSPYFRALYHFEAAVSQLYQAWDLCRKLFEFKLFDSGDASFFDRLNILYNCHRHVPAIVDQPLWIADTGLESKSAAVTFEEMEREVRRLARIAEKLTTPPGEAGGSPA